MEDPVDQTEAQEPGDEASQAAAPESAASADSAEQPVAAPEPVSASPLDSSKKWYVVHAYSGFEKNVARTLQERVELSNLKEFFGEILVPTEEVVEMRAGQKRRSERKLAASSAAPAARLAAKSGEKSSQEMATAPAERPRFSPWTLSMSNCPVTTRLAARCRPPAPRRPGP